MRNILAALVMGVVLVACTAHKQSPKRDRGSSADTPPAGSTLAGSGGLYCAAYGPTGFPPQWDCVKWCPTLPAGWFDCNSDTAVYPGECLVFTSPNYAGCCAGWNASGSWMSLGYWNEKVKSSKNRRGGTVMLYEHINAGGVFYSLPNGSNAASFSFGVSSISSN